MPVDCISMRLEVAYKHKEHIFTLRYDLNQHISIKFIVRTISLIKGGAGI